MVELESKAARGASVVLVTEKRMKHHAEPSGTALEAIPDLRRVDRVPEMDDTQRSALLDDALPGAASFRRVYVWSGVWQYVGFSCIIYLAALTSVDPTLHEAAIIDGASKLQRIRDIDLPTILPVAIVLLILEMGAILSIGFEKVLLLQNPINLPVSEVIDTYVYRVGLAAELPQFSYAAAIGLFQSVIAFVLIVVVNHIAKKVGAASLW